MKVIITENYEEMSRVAADIIIGIVKNNSEAVLGLATGSSPIGTYDNMVKDLYEYVIGKKENPFTYEHEYLVQEVLTEIVGGRSNV